MKFKAGDRVKPKEKDSFFSSGVVVEYPTGDKGTIYEKLGWMTVLMDETPPREYNMGRNHAVMAEDDFVLEAVLRACEMWPNTTKESE